MTKIEELLKAGKAKKHYTYYKTGVVSANLKKISGNAATDVNYCYIYPDGKIDLCHTNFSHYGYAHFGEDGKVYDDSNQNVFEIV